MASITDNGRAVYDCKVYKTVTMAYSFNWL